jgi:predicted deacylase
MSKNEVKFKASSIKIEPVGTHNTVPPFSAQIKKGIESEIWHHEIIGSAHKPRIYIGGGTHGDELNGVAAVLKLGNIIKEHKIGGTVILVPLQNPAAFKFRERLNPYDPIDPDWVHPGIETGTYSQRIKHVLNQLARDADCVIDLHTSGRGGTNNPMIYVPPEIGNGAGNRSLELAKIFGGDRLVFGKNEDEYDWPVKNTMPFVAVREGRMGLYSEAGVGGASIPDTRHVDYFVTGVLNVMKSLGMIEGTIEEQGERKISSPTESEQGVLATQDGIFKPIANLGSMVKRGDLMAEVWGLDGHVEKIYSPGEGLITYMNQYGSVGIKDTIYKISP